MKEKLQAEQTIAFVSHVGSTVKELCNRAVWIGEGVTKMEGPTDEVVDAYEEYFYSSPHDRSWEE